MMTRDRIFAARDPHGFRPLSMGRIINPDGPDTVVFASETCAFDLLRAKYERDVRPGEVVMVTREGVTSVHTPPACRRRAASSSTSTSRGPTAASLVAGYRPAGSRWAAAWRGSRRRCRPGCARSRLRRDRGPGIAAESGIPFNFGLIRNHYVGRTFIEPEQRVRDFGVKLKLNPVRNLLEGKRIILIDDSIIRGTTSRKIVRMVRSAGAREVHLRISCPPTISPCYYGVDTPNKSELIAANSSVEEIRQFIEADSFAYLSLEGLEQACDGDEDNRYCTACYTGDYPTQWVDVAEILPATAATR